MDKMEIFKVNLKGMKEQTAACDFILDDEYFQTIGSENVKKGSLNAHLDVVKAAASYQLRFHIKGTVVVPCDVCLEDMRLPIDTDNTIVVKMGEEYEDDGDLITIPQEDGIVDVAGLIDEFITLAIPIRHVHEPEECNQEMLARLKQLSPDNVETPNDNAADPRWNELEKLKTIFNKD
jgi:uncharacterized metal-binding protein YceD (DUF177 family)